MVILSTILLFIMTFSHQKWVRGTGSNKIRWPEVLKTPNCLFPDGRVGISEAPLWKRHCRDPHQLWEGHNWCWAETSNSFRLLSGKRSELANWETGLLFIDVFHILFLPNEIILNEACKNHEISSSSFGGLFFWGITSPVQVSAKDVCRVMAAFD